MRILATLALFVLAACNEATQETSSLSCAAAVSEVGRSANAVSGPIPKPYDPDLDAHAALDRAFSRAQLRETHVLAVLGGNWCPDCRILAAMLALPEHDRLLDACYEIVEIDVGRYDKNLDAVRRLGVDALIGAPTLAVITSDGALLNASAATEFRDARDRDPNDVLAYLKTWAPKDGA